MKKGIVAYLQLAAIASCLLPCNLRGQSAKPQQSVVQAGGTRAVYKLQTQSQALDWLDSREPKLDGMYVHNGSGAGVTVYVIDGGILAGHPEFGGRVARHVNVSSDTMTLCNGHGSAVASAAAGATLGVAPQATVVDIKTLDCGSGDKPTASARKVFLAAKAILQDRKLHPGPAVATMALTIDTSSHSEQTDSAVSMLVAAGITVVAAAGNYDIDACRVSPANAPGAIVAGGAKIDSVGRMPVDFHAPDTAWGSCVDLYAPWEGLLASATPKREPILQFWSGTSMSTGYVAGAAALFLAERPDAKPEEVRRALKQRATPGVVLGTNPVPGAMLFVGIERH